jgi:hypothetical protein
VDLIERFGGHPQFPRVNLERLTSDLRVAGFDLQEQRDQRLVTRFEDVGALVFYLRAVPWTVPGFSVTTHRRELLALQAQLDSGAPLTFTSRRLLIRATRVHTGGTHA